MKKLFLSLTICVLAISVSGFIAYQEKATQHTTKQANDTTIAKHGGVPMQGVVKITNETITPKIFSIESVTPKSKLRLRVSLKKDKIYQLEAGTYQITYYNIAKAKKHSNYFRLKGNDTVNVVFYKTQKSKYDADIKIE